MFYILQQRVTNHIKRNQFVAHLHGTYNGNRKTQFRISTEQEQKKNGVLYGII